MDWKKILIIVILILIAVFFILPMVTGERAATGGGIGGGLTSYPSGDVGQGGVVPDTKIISQRISEPNQLDYLPPKTSGTLVTAGSPSGSSTGTDFGGYPTDKGFFTNKEQVYLAGQKGIYITPNELAMAQKQEAKEFFEKTGMMPQYTATHHGEPASFSEWYKRNEILQTPVSTKNVEWEKQIMELKEKGATYSHYDEEKQDFVFFVPDISPKQIAERERIGREVGKAPIGADISGLIRQSQESFGTGKRTGESYSSRESSSSRSASSGSYYQPAGTSVGGATVGQSYGGFGSVYLGTNESGGRVFT